LHELDYRVFLNGLRDFEITRFRDYGGPTDKKICLLRHDVDYSIDQAVAMAEIEYDAQVKSSYYVLHTATYYNQPNFIERCRYLQDMGHEVGLHNNIITAALKDPYADPEKLLAVELAFLRGNGVDVVGTVSHGDDLCNELGYTNYQLFKGCVSGKKPERIAEVEFYQVDMARHGLDYEALFVKRHCYLSDSGGVWWWDYPRGFDVPPADDVMGYLENLAGAEGSFTLHVLAHPIWWRL